MLLVFRAIRAIGNRDRIALRFVAIRYARLLAIVRFVNGMIRAIIDGHLIRFHNSVLCCIRHFATMLLIYRSIRCVANGNLIFLHDGSVRRIAMIAV